MEAISHLSKGLALLKTLGHPGAWPAGLAIQASLGPVLIATKGYTAQRWNKHTRGRRAVSAVEDAAPSQGPHWWCCLLAGKSKLAQVGAVAPHGPKSGRPSVAPGGL